jgi:hypothetical protein
MDDPNPVVSDTHGELSFDRQARWDIVGRAMDILKAHFAKNDVEARHACRCPAENFAFNGVGCRCGGV